MKRTIPLVERAGYRTLKDALAEPGCPVCHVASRSAGRYIGSLLWESVTDVETRGQLRAARGFCRRHALMAIPVARGMSQATGMAIIYGDVLKHVADDARTAATARRRDRDVAPRAACPACAVVAPFVEGALLLLADADQDSELGLAARRDGRFLCLPHLRVGLGLVDVRPQAERLVQLFAPAADELRIHLAEFVRKHGYEAHDEEITPRERSAWIDAIRLVIGEP